MKGLVAMCGLLMALVVVMAFAIVELLVKLAPLVVGTACIWAVVKVMRLRRLRIDAHQECAHRRWNQCVGELSALTPTGPTVSAIAHRQRRYVVRGEDTGLLSDRDDGYVNVSAQAAPRVERLPASYQHRRAITPRRSAARRSERRRP